MWELMTMKLIALKLKEYNRWSFVAIYVVCLHHSWKWSSVSAISILLIWLCDLYTLSFYIWLMNNIIPLIWVCKYSKAQLLYESSQLCKFKDKFVFNKYLSRSTLYLSYVFIPFKLRLEHSDNFTVIKKLNLIEQLNWSE